MTPADQPAALATLFERQRTSYDRAAFPEWEVRRDRLRRLQALIERHEGEIEAAIDADFGGRPAVETQIAEVFPSLAELRGALRHGRRWMKARPVRVSKWFLPARAQIVPRPLGVIGIIVPWNYPLSLAVGPLTGALAAGNRAMIKLSEFTPAFAGVFARRIGETFAEDEVAVVTGGADVAAQFSALPFDHLVFTGSTAVGRHVMGAAARNLTPVTLELGGKSPAVVAPGFDLARAAARIMTGKLLNAGQTCIAPDYVLVPRAQVGAFVDAAQAAAGAMYPGGLAESDYCSVVNQRHYGRLVGYLDEAAAAGVAVRPLFAGRDRNDEAHRLAPHALVEPPSTLAVMRDEIFGPLLPVLGYDDVEGAVARVNAQPRPLAMYWFDDDADRADWALRHTHVGGACINDTLVHYVQDGLPFGGVGPSGMGHYHGQWGFETFSKLTPVFRQSRLNGMKLFTPPYRPHVAQLLRLMKRY